MFKPPLFILLSIAVFGHLTAQTTIQLTFTADANGSNQPLDSVLIKNLTQGGDTTLYGNDTVLIMFHGIGVPEMVRGHADQLILFPPGPNPARQSATVRIFLPRDAKVTLRAHDLPGRELTSIRQWLPAGDHTFAFTPGKEACYLLSVEALGQQQV